MGLDAERDPGGSRLNPYRRRRAAALACALVVVGALAWACTGDTGDEEPVRQAGAVAGATSAPPPTAMPTVTVTATTTPRPPDGGGPCRARDLVVNLSAGRDTYSGRARPEFRVTVVNMGGGSCLFDRASMDLRVTSGSDRIWSSAECRRGESSKTTLRRGIPLVETIIWNRGRGCARTTPARPGTYVATLKGHAKRQVFYLR
ncbi:hypothetical protein BZB76_5253 [Actinomadura pelletieri DSM 43383]|uniref:DUF4232 domain-containing protein n=1 Tax=Actinomadura pelletieri DSM 43383 TaxID=1120940 RepID=A0A495QFY4_9ACTN|nr:hypothetical protein [Actinomadura pelletieri]RKS70774.1 hypothetical protein BZB76_5253 [Actinomadura pelletieri DSM 43383]